MGWLERLVVWSHAFFVAHPPPNPSKSPITRPVALLQCFQFHQLTLKSHVFQNPRPNLRLGDGRMTLALMPHVQIPQKMRGSRKLVGWIVFVTSEIHVCLILSVENPARSLIHPSRYCRFSTLSQLKKTQHITYHNISIFHRSTHPKPNPPQDPSRVSKKPQVSAPPAGLFPAESAPRWPGWPSDSARPRRRRRPFRLASGVGTSQLDWFKGTS